MVKFIFKAYKNRLNIFYCSFFYTFLPIYENNDQILSKKKKKNKGKLPKMARQRYQDFSQKEKSKRYKNLPEDEKQD